MVKPDLLNNTKLLCQGIPRLLIFACLFIGFSFNASAKNITVAVATNFQMTLIKLKTIFESQSEHKLIIVSGSSGLLYAQITHGAPFDVFLSADVDRPILLEKNKIDNNPQNKHPNNHAKKITRFTYAIGQLALWSLNVSLKKVDMSILHDKQIKRIAIANPKLAPYGKAAFEVIQYLKIDNIKQKQVFGENISQAFHFVASGSADIGFVAVSQLKQLMQSKQLPPLNKLPKILQSSKDNYWLIPKEYYNPIEQQAFVIKTSNAVDEFVKFLQSDLARQTIKMSGYDLPESVML